MGHYNNGQSGFIVGPRGDTGEYDHSNMLFIPLDLLKLDRNS
jgi:hypothetical protein